MDQMVPSDPWLPDRMTEVISATVLRPRFNSLRLRVFVGLTALVLAGAELYGVIS
jgi:hypothetical protein